MTTSEPLARGRLSGGRERGFTLAEVVVVLGVIALLVATAAPLATALIDADRRDEVTRDLEELGTALESYYFEHAAFPTTLRATGFYGVHLQPGVRDSVLLDSWGGGSLDYGYSVSLTANTATVWSRGENGIDNGAANEDFALIVRGAVPGIARTRQRMRVIIEALATFLESGGTLSGVWATDRAAIGLGTQFATDGFGTAFQLDGATLVLRSAGPDRTFGNADDLTS